MGNRIARSASDSVTINHVDPPYRPIMDPVTGQPLHVCGYKDLLVDHSCAAGELWWESELEPDMNLRPKYAACKTRDMKDGVACDMNAGFPNVQPCQYHTCSTVLPEVDCKKFVIKKLIGSNDPNQYAKATLTVNPKAYDGRKYSCTYKTSEIGSSCEVATEFTQDAKDVIGLNPYDEWYDNATMNVLCSKRAPPSTCPIRPDGTEWPKDENGDPICSQLFGCDLCNAWAQSTIPGAAQESDAIMQEWCNANPKDPACNCIRRMDDDLYRTVQAGLVNMPLAGCWWKGCMDKKLQYNLVQSADRSAKDCPKVYCANIIQVTGGTVDIGTVNMSVSCEAGPDDDPLSCSPECGSHGTCVPGGLSGKGTCRCEAGWKGADCSVPDVTPPPDDECTLDCGAHGHCSLDLDDTPVCACDDNWEGVKCDQKEDVPPPDDSDKKAKIKKVVAIAAVSGVALVGVFLIASAFRKSRAK
jgi:hypothetical protein